MASSPATGARTATAADRRRERSGPSPRREGLDRPDASSGAACLDVPGWPVAILGLGETVRLALEGDPETALTGATIAAVIQADGTMAQRHGPHYLAKLLDDPPT